MSASAVTVLELAEAHRQKAADLEVYNPQTAHLMRTLAGEYEDAARRSMPEWWTLAAVQTSRPWSTKWLRRRCQDLVGVGKARKARNGHWLLRWDAVLSLPSPPRPREEIDPGDDLDAMADELAR